MLLWGSFHSFSQKQVLVFFDVECPICQKSSKRVQEMYERYRKEVDFKLIFPVKSVKKSDIRKFKREYLLTIPTIIDKKHALVERYDAKVTPEVIGLDNNGHVFYRFELGKNRPKMTEFYLEKALAALQNHQNAPPQTEPIGCLINRRKK
jgi:peroxiredoxin